jgi:hypothetical protein
VNGSVNFATSQTLRLVGDARYQRALVVEPWCKRYDAGRDHVVTVSLNRFESHMMLLVVVVLLLRHSTVGHHGRMVLLAQIHEKIFQRLLLLLLTKALVRLLFFLLQFLLSRHLPLLLRRTNKSHELGPVLALDLLLAPDSFMTKIISLSVLFASIAYEKDPSERLTKAKSCLFNESTDATAVGGRADGLS